ncbi:hypothetical protein [Methanolobus profundi]|uniref:Uncharacterized protein n=1 Tax=Methanolobus profundi TaxID=487685 RepID=A0A1I4QQ24_9EURY|nr:hypothetical protein [Methanolobus profundi]SFM42109.1 hypothetical protein SAMN04488696_1137 [Methanolobus profundi]
MIDVPRELPVETDVQDFILKAKKDFRLCTTCGGPAIVPTTMSEPKDSDIKVSIGNNTLHVSKVQARYIRQIEMRMLLGYINYCERNGIEEY